MMVVSYKWNETLPSGTSLDSSITTNLSALNWLIGDLEGCGYDLSAINEEGIAIKLIDVAIPTPSYPDLEIGSQDYYKLDARIFDIEKFITKKQSQPHEKEVSSEFFLLFDFLPEHIRKELKIYIK